MAARLYGIVDAARDPGLHPLVLTCEERVCLFAGEIKPPLHRVAPYLVRLAADAPLTRAWRSDGWGQQWGLLCVSQAGLNELRRHFRQFLQARLPDGQVVLFRFYDPRVFRPYVATLNEEERGQWFAAVDEFRVETEDGGGILACHPDGTCKVTRIGGG